MAHVKAGSFSRLSKYEECAFRLKLEAVDRVPEPDRGPPPKGLTEWHDERGIRIHDEADKYIRGDSDGLITELKPFQLEFEHLQTLFSAGQVLPEMLWCYDRDWNPCESDDWNNIYFRIKSDVTVFYDESCLKALLVDFKTGKRKGNEMKHRQQLQLYCEIWYLDHPELETYPESYTRVQAMALLKRTWIPRMERLFNDRVFKPSPTYYSCRWCPYNKRRGSGAYNKRRGSGACPHAAV
jgi:hypothetical protein